MRQKTRCFYDFGAFRLDAAERVLVKADSRITLTPKAFETLLVLLENAGHVLEKDDLLKRIWPDTFVEEGTLARNISTLRKALGDGAEGLSFIETVPRHGYRFVAPVQQIPYEEPQAAVATVGHTQIETCAELRSWMPRSWLLTAGLLAILLAGVYVFWQHSLYLLPVSANRTTLAVLPFENLSGEEAQQFFADGFSEEMITQLGELEPDRLTVIARTSAMHYQRTSKDPLEAGRELGVEYVLTGSIRRDADRTRITARLIRTEDGTNLWAKNYDRSVRDILALQSEVASSIAREISLKLSPEKNARLAEAPPVDPEAYEDYLKGRYFWNKRTAESYIKAIGYFKEAIARDPKYAQAYSGLADAYALLGSSPNDEISRSEAMPKAKAAALAALQLDDSLAEAHTSLAFEEMHYEWDWLAADREFQRALQLNPNYATAHQWYAYWLMAHGQADHALSQLSLAEKADPLSIIIKSDTSDLLACAGRYEQAVQAAKNALELDPNFTLAHYSLAEAYGAQHMYPQAIVEYQKMLATDSGNAWALTGMARAYAGTGERAIAERYLQDTLQKCRNHNDCALEIASIYGSLGENDQAFAWLEKAYQAHEGGLILINGAISLQCLRTDARFADMARRMGLSLKDSEVAKQTR